MAMIDHHSAALINELRRHGITVSVDDIPGILRSGIDNLLDQRGIELNPESVTVLHLILHELRSDYENIIS
jgi:EAL domain-containing protein (putative c-di-GMP-specific phosphodiesterase class I)